MFPMVKQEGRMANLQSNTPARVAVVSSLETETDSILCNNLVLNLNESTDVVGMSSNH